jgi:hypothetical protein
MNLVPCVQEAILSEVVRERLVPRQLAKKIPHLRLVTPDEFAECVRILAGHHTRDEKLVVDCSSPLYLS